MEEILDWLIEIELLAARLYEKAAIHFIDDKEFADFLNHLMKDEKSHHAIISRAVELTKNKGGLPELGIVFDSDVKENIEGHLLLTEKRIEANHITKEGMMEFIVFSEFSEWNDVFLYVINGLKHQYREFIPVVARIQQHKKHIERFIESHPEFRSYLDNIKLLPGIWEEKILVVDDEDMIVDLLSAIFADEGIIESASNGRDALEKVMGKYYAAIVTDVDMPVMNGIEFYNKAIEKYPNLKERFLFFTGFADESRLSFFKANNLRYLIKPASISKIKEQLADILSK